MKKTYRKIIRLLSRINIEVYKLKVWIAEWTAILRKKGLYKDVKYSNEQNLKIEVFWKKNYGKSISNRWHKLYESINGVFNEYYFPDVVFSTELEPKLNPIDIAKFISDKSITELIYKGVSDIRFPETILINANGYYYNKSRNIITEDKGIEILMNIDEFVIKPTLGGSSGNSVQVISIKDKKDLGKKEVISNLLQDYKENYIIQHKLKPQSQYERLYPSAINTIRLITYIAADGVHHAPLCLRMGCGGNKVDNIHAGGIVIGISDEGVLMKYGYQLGYCNSKAKYISHPDTNILFENYKVPETQKMIKVAKQLHGNTPHLGIISWDFMVDDLDQIVLVEGNYFGQSIWFPQIAHGKPIFREDTEYFIKLSKGSRINKGAK